MDFSKNLPIIERRLAVRVARGERGIGKEDIGSI
jgi:hypothetical protein